MYSARSSYCFKVQKSCQHPTDTQKPHPHRKYSADFSYSLTPKSMEWPNHPLHFALPNKVLVLFKTNNYNKLCWTFIYFFFVWYFHWKTNIRLNKSGRNKKIATFYYFEDSTYFICIVSLFSLCFFAICCVCSWNRWIP